MSPLWPKRQPHAEGESNEAGELAAAGAESMFPLWPWRQPDAEGEVMTERLAAETGTDRLHEPLSAPKCEVGAKGMSRAPSVRPNRFYWAGPTSAR